MENLATLKEDGIIILKAFPGIPNPFLVGLNIRKRESSVKQEVHALTPCLLAGRKSLSRDAGTETSEGPRPQPGASRARMARRIQPEGSILLMEFISNLGLNLQPAESPVTVTIRHRDSLILWRSSRQLHCSPTDCTRFGDTCISYRAPGYNRKIFSPCFRIL